MIELIIIFNMNEKFSPNHTDNKLLLFSSPVYALYSFHKGLRILLEYDSKWRVKLVITVKGVIYTLGKFTCYAASLKPHKIPPCV